MDISDEEIIEFWKRLYDSKVEYILVGGFAVMLHGGTRTTEDIDIWIKDTIENRKKLKKVFEQYDYPSSINFETMQFVPGWTTLYISHGIELDVMTKLSGFEQERFDECLAMSYKAVIDGIEVPFLHINHLIQEKTKVARPKDLIDLEELERIKKYQEENK
ncbi:MAG: nucleotidyltransferase [Bacteroidota bacterium]